MRGALLVVTALSFAAADVAPSCGKRSRPEPRLINAGDACGGPFVCASPTACVTLDATLQMPSYSSAYVCTKACTSDAECAGLGLPMRCTGSGRVRGGPTSERVCLPTIATSDAGR